MVTVLSSDGCCMSNALDGDFEVIKPEVSLMLFVLLFCLFFSKTEPKVLIAFGCLMVQAHITGRIGDVLSYSFIRKLFLHSLAPK